MDFEGVESCSLVHVSNDFKCSWLSVDTDLVRNACRMLLGVYAVPACSTVRVPLHCLLATTTAARCIANCY
jgi:hypothetical protein